LSSSNEKLTSLVRMSVEDPPSFIELLMQPFAVYTDIRMVDLDKITNPMSRLTLQSLQYKKKKASHNYMSIEEFAIPSNIHSMSLRSVWKGYMPILIKFATEELQLTQVLVVICLAMEIFIRNLTVISKENLDDDLTMYMICCFYLANREINNDRKDLEEWKKLINVGSMEELSIMIGKMKENCKEKGLMSDILPFYSDNAMMIKKFIQQAAYDPTLVVRNKEQLANAFQSSMNVPMKEVKGVAFVQEGKEFKLGLIG
jgi:hypothetical protein